MARKKNIPAPDEERELDRAYWELTGYKFNQKKRSPLPWIILLGCVIAAAWYLGIPELLLEYFS